jgi:hypothetical protein
MDEGRKDMTDAPEKIWAYAGSFKMWRDHKTDRGQRQTEYTRTDVTDARIKELEKELGHCIYELNRADSRKPHRDRRAGLARKALKGEKT